MPRVATLPTPNKATTRPRRARQEQADVETTSDRIIRHTTELFARKGFHATGVQEICETVGLGRGALYYHIKSKEQLLYTISISLVADMLNRAQQIVESELSTEAMIRALGRQLLRNLAEHRSGWRVSLYESQALSKPLRDEVLRARDEYERMWAAVLAHGADQGLVKPVSPLMLRGILGLLNSTFLWLDAEGPQAPDDVADIYIDLLLDGLRPRAGPP
jgi:TetR/AcrR family transcriptional regulator, cholesterol catabolism regulator